MLFDQIKANKLRSVILLATFFFLLIGIGGAVGYLAADMPLGGVFIAFVISVIYAVSVLAQATQVVMRMNHAREVTVSDYPDLYHVVEDMAMVAQVPMPRVFVIDDPSLNAFAAGPDPKHAAVAATTGLLEVLTREELEAVMGHEISHIRHYDIRLSTVAVALASAISLLSSFGSRLLWYGGSSSRQKKASQTHSGLLVLLSLVAVVLAPVVATIIQLAISRQREYLADAGAVELTRNPQGMIKALRKLDQSVPMRQPVDSASAALYIHAPKRLSRMEGLFRTHPPIADRIAHLESL